MTLAEKAKAVRNHLKEKGDTYTHLLCTRTGILCFPIELNLQWLNLSNNQIPAFPPEITGFTQNISIVLSNSPYALFADHFSPCPANLSRSFFMNSFGYSIQKDLKTFLGYVRNDVRKNCVR